MSYTLSVYCKALRLLKEKVKFPNLGLCKNNQRPNNPNPTSNGPMPITALVRMEVELMIVSLIMLYHLAFS